MGIEMYARFGSCREFVGDAGENWLPCLRFKIPEWNRTDTGHISALLRRPAPDIIHCRDSESLSILYLVYPEITYLSMLKYATSGRFFLIRID